MEAKLAKFLSFDILFCEVSTGNMFPQYNKNVMLNRNKTGFEKCLYSQGLRNRPIAVSLAGDFDSAPPASVLEPSDVRVQ